MDKTFVDRIGPVVVRKGGRLDIGLRCPDGVSGSAVVHFRPAARTLALVFDSTQPHPTAVGILTAVLGEAQGHEDAASGAVVAAAWTRIQEVADEVLKWHSSHSPVPVTGDTI